MLPLVLGRFNCEGDRIKVETALGNSDHGIIGSHFLSDRERPPGKCSRDFRRLDDRKLLSTVATMDWDSGRHCQRHVTKHEEQHTSTTPIVASLGRVIRMGEPPF